MKPEAQRIAIAEACGWIQVSTGKWFSPKDQKAIDEKRFGDAIDGSFLPDYLNDLNAMHEAEKVLSTTPGFGQLSHYRLTVLPRVCGGDAESITATAAQRAEAFLKTLGLWEEA